MRVAVTLVVLLISGALLAQTPADPRLVPALIDALKPALPYPDADQHHLPVNGSPTPLWIVRWPEPGETRVEVVANPLNAENQERANKADGEIQRAVMAAQQRAQSQYERAVAEFEKTGRTNAIDGITLGDEGIAGERFDASNRVVITLSSGAKEYRIRVSSSSEPAVSATDYAAIVRVGANVFRARASAGQPEQPRFHAAEAHLIFGAAAPAVTRTSSVSFEIVAVPGSTAAMVSLQGNEALVEQILVKANWQEIVRILKTAG